MSNKDLIQQMKGRAKFCRDRGEIKTPELLERASNLLESQETEELQAALLIASEGMQAAKRIIERKNKQLLAAEAEIARLQSRVDGAMDFYNTAKSDANIGMIRMAQYLKGEVR